ncbi:MAG TPA: hypothetical protein VJH37_04120 [Candidatus Nanoarchaeia archaeon]|nr:hypothetical protein [Candidatus Nanoarchaeia archaeon]
MSFTVIAPLYEHSKAIYIGIKEFPTNKLSLLCPLRKKRASEKIRRDLQKFRIPVDIHFIRGPLWEELFRLISFLSKDKQQDILVNVGAGDRTSRCAALSAAFVNGLKTFDVVDDTTMMLPVLKFSYYHLLTKKKLLLLRHLLAAEDYTLFFEDLGKKAKMGSSLLSYHLHGTYKTEGLEQLGLISLKKQQDRLIIHLTTLGKLLIQGYIQ